MTVQTMTVRTMTVRVRRAVGGGAGLALVLALVGCGGDTSLLEAGVHAQEVSPTTDDGPTTPVTGAIDDSGAYDEDAPACSGDACFDSVGPALDAPEDGAADGGCEGTTCFSQVGPEIGTQQGSESWPRVTGIPGLEVALPGDAVHTSEPIAGTDLVMDSWAVQSGLLYTAAGVAPVIFGDGRSSEQRLEDGVAGMAAATGGTVVSAVPADWLGAPAVDVEMAVDTDGGYVAFARLIDLPDGRVLMLETVGASGSRDLVLRFHEDVVASLALAL